MLSRGDKVIIINNEGKKLGEGIVDHFDEATWLVYVAFRDGQVLACPYQWLYKIEE